MTETLRHIAPEMDRITQSEDSNFLEFAADEAYREVNRQVLTFAFPYLPQDFIHVDCATGTGLVPQELGKLSEETRKRGRVIGVDLDPFAIKSARQATPTTDSFDAEFIVGKAQDLPILLAGKIPEDGVDGTSINDAIHEIPGVDAKRAVLGSMADILRPGGVLVCNSAFTTIAMEEDPMGWGRWKAKAMNILGVKRDKTIEPITIHRSDEYVQMIADTGLVIIHEAKRPIVLSKAALEGISKYPEFILGVFRDMVNASSVSLQDKSQALIAALDALQIDGLRRTWHEVVAQKPFTT